MSMFKLGYELIQEGFLFKKKSTVKPKEVIVTIDITYADTIKSEADNMILSLNDLLSNHKFSGLARLGAVKAYGISDLSDDINDCLTGKYRMVYIATTDVFSFTTDTSTPPEKLTDDEKHFKVVVGKLVSELNSKIKHKNLYKVGLDGNMGQEFIALFMK